jgi:MFS family permease
MFLIMNFFIGISAIFGGLLLKKIREVTAIYTWAVTIIGTILLLTYLTNFYIQLFIICIQGVFHGICTVSFAVYFSRQTRIEERGRIGGIVIFLSLLLAALLSPLAQQENLSLIMIFLCISSLSVFLLKPENESVTIAEKTIHDNTKSFFSYYIPWMIFCLNNSVFPIITQHQLHQLFPEIVNLMQLLSFLGGCFGAVVAGFMADRIGRKLVLMYGLTSLGIVYTFAGFSKQFEAIVLLYFSNGFSWGIFLLLYYLVIWGEIRKEKGWTIYQSIGLSTFHFSQTFGSLIVPLLLKLDIQFSILASAMMVFISNIFLIYAHETLPTQYVLEFEELKNYINRVKRELARARPKEK